MLNKLQILMLEEYLHYRKTFPLSPGDKEKKEILRLLNNFLKKLDHLTQKKILNWFHYQLTCIDYKILPAIKFADFALEHKLVEHLAVSEDGESLVFLMHDQHKAQNIADKIKKIFDINISINRVPV
jgi:hypothetical protein